MKKLSKELVIRLHDMLIEKSGGSKGIRDINLLESSLNSDFQTYITSHVSGRNVKWYSHSRNRFGSLLKS